MLLPLPCCTPLRNAQVVSRRTSRWWLSVCFFATKVSATHNSASKNLIEDSLTDQSWGYWATRGGTWSSTFFCCLEWPCFFSAYGGPKPCGSPARFSRVSISPPLQWNNTKPLNSDLHPWDPHVAANLLVQWNLASQPANRKVGSPFHSCEWNRKFMLFHL